MSVQDAAEELDTSSGVIFNLARELRLVGVSGSRPNQVVLVDEVRLATDREGAVRARVARALRRHKIHTLVSELLGHATEPLSVTRLAQEMAAAFAAVEAKPSSWLNYARAFAAWLDYADLVSMDRDGNLHPFDPLQFDEPPRLLSGSPTRRRLRQAFPQAPAGPAEDLLKHLAGAGPAPAGRKLAPAIRDLASLHAVVADVADRLQLVRDDLVVNGEVNPVVLRRLMEVLPGMAEVLVVLESRPWAPPSEIGGLLRDAYGAHWAEGTVLSNGKYARSWARLVGVQTRLKPPQAAVDSGDPRLFDSVSDGEDEDITYTTQPVSPRAG
jgi:hypothetical protein